MLKRVLKSKPFRYSLPFAHAAILGGLSIKVFGDKYPAFMGLTCLGLFMGLILESIIREWK